MSKKLITEEFIKRAILIHDNKYDYSEVIYKGIFNKITIICKEHGKFYQEANSHLSGNGCPKCAFELSKKNRTKTNTKFIEESYSIHKDRFDYSKTNYINSHKKLIIICKQHGEFECFPGVHLSNNGGCPLCSKRLKKTQEIFLKECEAVHKDKYDYSESFYINYHTKIKIRCKQHGIFEQSPANHLRGVGCKSCQESYGERAVRYYLENNNIKYISEKKFKECKYKRALPFDFYLSNYNLCIEYDGEQHFESRKISKNVTDEENLLNFKQTQINDILKNNYCFENKIRLLRIPYWEKNNMNELLTFCFEEINDIDKFENRLFK